MHFNMPPGLEKFSRFAQLPYDIRHKIWEHIIFTPGIHFLRFERNDLPRFASDDDDDSSDYDTTDDEGEVGRGKAMTKATKQYSASLTPIFPLPAADMSYYITASKTLAQLSLVCNESAYEVDLVTKKPNNLTLDNGRLISLATSSDVICIDYPDLCYPRGLGKWADNLDLEQLGKVRRLAVRYQPEWDEERRLCRRCGRYHHAVRKELPRRHLYEFLALFNNLETFFFIDYLIVRKPNNQQLDGCEESDLRWLGPHARAKMMALSGVDKGERFESGGRTYYEIDRELTRACKVNSHVFNMLEWLQGNYTRYCEKKRARRHSSPRRVKFSVLACEWDHENMKNEKKRPSPVNVPRTRGAPIEPALKEAMHALKLEDQNKAFDRPAYIPVVFGDEGVSKYEFTFEIKF